MSRSFDSWMYNAGQLHILTDTHCAVHSHLEIARSAFAAGVDVVQYRQKGFDRRLHLPELQEILEIRKNYRTKVLINDYWELALELGADGVHLGKADDGLESALRHPNAGFIVGATVHTMQELTEVQALTPTYIGVGPVFGTHSKRMEHPPLGIAQLRAFIQASRIPVIAIGNLNASNVAEALDAGAAGVAVLGAVCNSADPLAAIRELQSILKTYSDALPARKHLIKTSI